MSELHLPWLELAVLLPLLGSLWVKTRNDPDVARRYSLALSAAGLFCAVGAWQDFGTLDAAAAHDRWDLFTRWFGPDVFVIDELSAPLLPLVSLLYTLTVLSTLRTKAQRFSFSMVLFAQALVTATLCSKHPWVIVLLLVAATIPPWIELVKRRKPTRVYLLHMALFVGLIVAGQWLVSAADAGGRAAVVGATLLTAAVLLRSGIAPVHCWMTDLFEHASFGTALLFVTPMVGAYGAMRLVLPVAPDWLMRAVTLLSLFTAIYAAGMALVQHEARRFFCYLFLSNSSLVFFGLELATPIGLTGALCVWVSVSLALTGFGLMLRSVEARTGRLSLDQFHGLYDHAPRLAGFFLLTGLASIGFPGTVGFVGAELLVEAAVESSPLVGSAIVIAAALNGLAVLHAYFRVFTGTRHAASVDLRSRPPEVVAVLVLTLLILGGGLFPQAGVSTRYHAATELIRQRHGGAPAVADRHETARHR